VFCGSKVSNQAMDEKYCEAVLKPTSSQTCHNRKCKGSWKIGDWSEVNTYLEFGIHAVLFYFICSNRILDMIYITLIF
jgi:hypothetical protein